MASKIQLRRDVRENWEFVNPVLSQGEPGLQIAENLIKIGDGVTAWNDLQYYNYLDTGSYAKLVGGNYLIGNQTIDGTLFVTASGTEIMTAIANVQGTALLSIQNQSSLNDARTSVNAINDVGRGILIGMNGSRTNTRSSQPNDAFILTNGEDLNIGTIQTGSASIKFFTGTNQTGTAPNTPSLIVSGSTVSVDGEFYINGTPYTSQTSGTAGTSGTSATSGTSGTSGTNGTAGSGGSSGTSATSGTSGTNGTSGTDGVSDRYQTTSTSSFTLGGGNQTIFVESG